MAHRTIDVSGAPVEVFETGFAALRWIKKSAEDCRVLARGSFYFQRKSGFEMTIRLNATDCPENRHLVAAANAVADEAERALETHKAAV